MRAHALATLQIAFFCKTMFEVYLHDSAPKTKRGREIPPIEYLGGLIDCLYRYKFGLYHAMEEKSSKLIKAIFDNDLEEDESEDAGPDDKHGQ